MAMSCSSISSDQWKREFKEAVKLADDVSDMISKREDNLATSSIVEERRYLATIRRRIAILRTKLYTIHSLHLLPNTTHDANKPKEKRRTEKFSNLRAKVEEMATEMNMPIFDMWNGIGDTTINQTIGLDNQGIVNLQKQIIKEQDQSLEKLEDNQGIVNLQKQIIKEQDQSLEKLEEPVTSTKHIALTINEELGLHTRLLDTMDQHAEVTSSRLLLLQKKLHKLNNILADKYTVQISSATILLLLVAIYLLIK